MYSQWRRRWAAASYHDVSTVSVIAPVKWRDKSYHYIEHKGHTSSDANVRDKIAPRNCTHSRLHWLVCQLVIIQVSDVRRSGPVRCVCAKCLRYAPTSTAYLFRSLFASWCTVVGIHALHAYARYTHIRLARFAVMAAAVRRFVAAVAFVFSYQEHNICGAEASRVRRRSIVSNGHRQHHSTKSVCVCVCVTEKRV